MEFGEVVRKRRMVRRYSSAPVDGTSVDRLLRNAVRAPSAGHTQGWAFLVLEQRADVDLFWEAATPPSRAAEPDPWLRGMRSAPVVIVPLSSKGAYLDRYAEADKGWTDRDETRWPVPYWHVDAGMASLLILLTSVDEGLGACFFGIPEGRVAALRAAFGVPSQYTPVGAITVGHADGAGQVRGSAATRKRRLADDVIHRGRWSG
ncbi:nitroreductase family protein [Lysobacter korlensis]|uniref:Nitroreductase family protein n=1 Tax=Lysobacter korlensis TaxID=553636 RepID=A0ABV6RUE3_9GAMM